MRALLDALHDTAPLVRATAVLALAKTGAKAAVPLVALLQTERDDRVREALYRVVVRLHARAAVPRLVALLEAPKTRSANLVADALEKLTGQQLGAAPKAWRAWLDAQHTDHGAQPPSAKGTPSADAH